MPFRPPRKRKPPKIAFVPVVMPQPISQHVKDCVVKFAKGLGKDVPVTDEDFAGTHPLTLFRAVMAFHMGDPNYADVIMHQISECGMSVMAMAPVEEKLIIT